MATYGGKTIRNREFADTLASFAKDICDPIDSSEGFGNLLTWVKSFGGGGRIGLVQSSELGVGDYRI